MNIRNPQLQNGMLRRDIIQRTVWVCGEIWRVKKQVRRWFHWEGDCRAFAAYFNRVIGYPVYEVIRDGQYWCAVSNYSEGT